MAKLRNRPRSAAVAVTALALIAGWLWIADQRSASLGGAPAARAEGVLPPRAVRGPALGVVRRTPFEVRLAGTVRNTAAAPIAGASVCAACADCLLGLARSATHCVQTDARGEFVLEQLERGDYRLTAGASGFEPALVAGGRVVHVGDDGVRADGLDGVLAAGGALVTGVVVDATGGSVAGAAVEALFVPRSLRGFPVLQTTTADDDGAFAISVPRGGARFIARADGYSPGDVYTTAPATNVRLVMAPEASVAGHVVTADSGQPVANVRVRAERNGVEQSANSDDQGAFRITGLTPGTFNLTASGKGWLGRMSGSVTVDVGEQTSGVLVHVYPGAAVSGVLQIGAEPCTSGKASLVPAPGQALPRVDAFTDVQGRVRFEAVLRGHYHSAASCDDFGQMQGPDVEVGEADRDGLVWRFDPRSTVAIAAKTAGIAAQRTWIELQHPLAPGQAQTPPPEAPHAGWTDDQGEIRFYGVKPGAYQVQSTELATPVPVEVRAGDNRFEIAIDARGYLDVQVRTASGQPNDDVGVYAMPVGRQGRFGQATRFDTGRYRLGPLAAGAYDVHARDGANPAARARAEVRAGTVTAVELSYGGYEGAITGQVVDDRGADVANVWVTAEPTQAEHEWFTSGLEHEDRVHHRRVASDAAGRFEITGLDPRGRYHVVATRRLGGEQRVSGIAVGQHVQVVLSSTATLTGSVVDPNGEPVKFFRLHVENTLTRQVLVPLFGPEARGRFRVEDVTAGSVTVSALTADGERASRAVEVRAGQALTVDLQIAPSQAHAEAQLDQAQAPIDRP